MKSRDEILDAIKSEGFSTRRRFFLALAEAAKTRLGIEGLSPAWPDALNILTPEDWNGSFDVAMAHKMKWQPVQVGGEHG